MATLSPEFFSQDTILASLVVCPKSGRMMTCFIQFRQVLLRRCGSVKHQTLPRSGRSLARGERLLRTPGTRAHVTNAPRQGQPDLFTQDLNLNSSPSAPPGRGCCCRVSRGSQKALTPG